MCYKCVGKQDIKAKELGKVCRCGVVWNSYHCVRCGYPRSLAESNYEAKLAEVLPKAEP